MHLKSRFPRKTQHFSVFLNTWTYIFTEIKSNLIEMAMEGVSLFWFQDLWEYESNDLIWLPFMKFNWFHRQVTQAPPSPTAEVFWQKSPRILWTVRNQELQPSIAWSGKHSACSQIYTKTRRIRVKQVFFRVKQKDLIITSLLFPEYRFACC